MRITTALLCLAAAAPFAPAAWQVVAGGIPDILFAGDAAALELRVLHAARGVQLLGPYSQWGWSHPGPAYFYLALPVYELVGQRGPALNVFALLVNTATSIALVLTVRRLFDTTTAIATAALVAVYVLVAAPFLPANEWNPILPMLPLALLTLVVTQFSTGHDAALPGAAVLASVIVQTHVGYGLQVMALTAFAAVARRGFAAVGSAVWRWTIAAVVACWALPVYEALITRPGNLQRLVAFFAPGNLGEQSWTDAWQSVQEQLIVMPGALAKTIGLPIETSGASAAPLVTMQLAALVAILFASLRRRHRVLTRLSAAVLVQIVTAVFAVRAIRGDITFYLVAWISVLGLLTWVAFAAFLVGGLRRSASRPMTEIVLTSASVLLVALTLRISTPSPAVFREPDPAAESLARQVSGFLRSTPAAHPVVRIRSREVWPTAAALVLHLYKERVPIAVEPSWEFLFGRQLAVESDARPELLVGDQAFHEEARTDPRLIFVGDAGGVYVFWDATG